MNNSFHWFSSIKPDRFLGTHSLDILVPDTNEMNQTVPHISARAKCNELYDHLDKHLQDEICVRGDKTREATRVLFVSMLKFCAESQGMNMNKVASPHIPIAVCKVPIPWVSIRIFRTIESEWETYSVMVRIAFSPRLIWRTPSSQPIASSHRLAPVNK